MSVLTYPQVPSSRPLRHRDSNTDLAKSTAIVVECISDSSSPELSGAQGDSGTSMPRESREESISSLQLTGPERAAIDVW